MELSMVMVAGDLAKWHPRTSFSHDACARVLRYACPVLDGAPVGAGVLFLVKASELSQCSLDGAGNLLVVGTPGQGALEAFDGNAIVIDVDEAAYGAVNRECLELFARYDAAYLAAAERAGGSAALPEVVSACSALFGRPLSVWSLVEDKLLCTEDEGPLPFALGGKGAAFSAALQEAAAQARGTAPFLLLDQQVPGGLSGCVSVVCALLRVEQRPVAALLAQMHAASSPERDKQVLALAAGLVQRCLRRASDSGALSFDALVEQVRLLMERKLSSWQLLESVIADYGWDLLDEYVCFVVVPSMADASLAAAFARVFSSSASAAGAVCVPEGNQGIVLANLTRATLNTDQIAELILDTVARRGGTGPVGISTCFSDLQDLYHYVEQAKKAAELGLLLDPGRDFYRFEDYYLDFIAQCCLKSSSATALFPSGYNRLRNYERSSRKGVALEAFVERFIESGFQMKPTVAADHCSRTTAFSKLKKVKEITGMDFEDQRVRTALLVASHAIRLSKASPQGGDA